MAPLSTVSLSTQTARRGSVQCIPKWLCSSTARPIGIQAKLMVVGMVSNRLTIADSSDPHTLNLAGFDTSTPEVLSMFARGEL